MKRLKELLLEDWQYKLFALFAGITLWFFINFGERVPTSIERAIEVYHKEEGYEYRLDRKRVRIRLRVMERFVSEEELEKISAGVDVRGLKEGEYTLRLFVKNVPKFFVSVEKIEPEFVRVRVIRAPGGGK